MRNLLESNVLKYFRYSLRRQINVAAARVGHRYYALCTLRDVALPMRF